MTTQVEPATDIVEAEIVEAEIDEVPEPTPAEAYVKGLRDLADWLEQRPGLVSSWSALTASFWARDAEDLAAKMRIFGAGEKIESDYESGIRRQIGPHIVRVATSKENTCKKVVTGTKKVRKVASSVAELPEDARNVQTMTTTQLVYEATEPVEEWRCPPSLLHPEPKESPA